jgi:hypothetical protein
MHIDREDIKRGIDNAAQHLKNAVDSVADSASESGTKVRDKARDAARRAGDELIEQGQKLKRAAAGGEEHDELREGTPPC